MGCSCCGADPKTREWNRELQTDAIVDRKQKKLLLLGPGNSCKSTFFKQLLKIHGDGFNDPKRFDQADVIRSIFDCIIAQMKAIIRTVYIMI